MISVFPTRLAGGAALALLAAISACAPSHDPAREEARLIAAAGSPQPGQELGWALAGAWRLDPGRDAFRHPKETLGFFGLAPGMAVIEIYPGRGWYTDILAPYTAKTGGSLTAAVLPGEAAAASELARQYAARLQARAALYGPVRVVPFGPDTLTLGPDGSADLVLTFRNVHSLMAAGYVEDAFAAFYRVLKPGGALGVVEHRASASGLQDPQASDGYVQEEFVKRLAQEAGFTFEGASSINANPKDTRTHPFGVWTLPPVLRTAPLGQPPDPAFNTAPYRAIGESDRMTLLFRKPAQEAPAPEAAPTPQ
ncbi:MAG: methyltransferase domain-containing protein [Hyphomonadaceae bacterium]|nr:methyltransferase domain-containing protein [Hyphomonadaceae bacterium]